MPASDGGDDLSGSATHSKGLGMGVMVGEAIDGGLEVCQDRPRLAGERDRP
jgi:hypothetical protein